ncbi:MAG: hypothetical protein Kow0031_09120 [Anaerolineae bacterium]
MSETANTGVVDTASAWVTVSGTVTGRVGCGHDGITRFSVKNRNGRFYVQCPTKALKNHELLQRDARLIIAGNLFRIFDGRRQRHQVVIKALSLSLVHRDARMVSLLSQVKTEPEGR